MDNKEITTKLEIPRDDLCSVHFYCPLLHNECGKWFCRRYTSAGDMGIELNYRGHNEVQKCSRCRKEE